MHTQIVYFLGYTWYLIYHIIPKKKCDVKRLEATGLAQQSKKSNDGNLVAAR